MQSIYTYISARFFRVCRSCERSTTQLSLFQYILEQNETQAVY